MCRGIQKDGYQGDEEEEEDEVKEGHKPIVALQTLSHIWKL